MKKRVIALALCLVMLATCLGAGILAPTPVKLVDENGAAANDAATDRGMVINKTANANGDGSYTITLEAYATGEKFISEVTEDVPTDIILVLDQSGSMDDAFDTITSDSYSVRDNSNMENYPYRQNGGSDNIWYKLSDGSFVRVSMRIKQNTENVEWKSCITWHLGFGDCLWNGDMVEWSDAGVLYQLLDDGTYARCYVTGSILSGGYTYTYADGTSEYVRVGSNPTQVDKSRFFYASSGVTNIYDYFYVDADGKEVAIETSTGDNTKPTETYYSLTTTSSDRTKLQALKDAVSQFSGSVAEKAAATGVNHRIAVVGFASGNTWNGRNYNYNNTEVFVGANEYRYGSAAQGVYSTAFMDMNDPNDVANVTASIGALDANGGTLTNLGVEMANGIFNANPVPAGEQRNRVVIVFTDGQPGWSGYDSTTAANSIDQAATTKNIHGATVYTVGIFEGANVNGTDKTNTFMRNLSSGNGYYLTASDSNELNNIFQQISNNIESGGSSTTLDANAVIRDIIAPQFELPANATTESIKLYTAESNGSVNSWKTRETFAGSVSLGTNDNSVSVSGFSFKDNWCGNETINGQDTFHDGKKLIIEFTVQPKAGFLGGNDVYTNTSAGVYENGSANDPVLSFPRPQVNVPIDDVTVTANDKNVYLKGEVTAAQLKEGATVTVGEGTKAVSLDLSKANENYGLEPWQTEYVNITVTVKDKDGNPISDKLADLTKDTTYTVEVTVAPKTQGASTPEKGDAATAKTGVNDPAANIYVFKPEVTFKDSAIDLGQTPNYAKENFVSVVWKHNNDVANSSEMGQAPALTYKYKPDAAVFGSDTTVEVTEVLLNNVNVRDFAAFEFGGCDYNNCAGHGDWNFVVHIKTFDLTIIKSITGYESKLYGSQDFVFNVKCADKNIDIDVVVNVPDGETKGSVTIKGLPVGTYTITENTGWSWRYELQGAAKPTGATGTVVYNEDSSSATYTPGGANNQIIFTNNWVQAKWLSFTDSVKNIFSKPNT